MATSSRSKSTKYIGASPPEFPVEAAAQVAKDMFGITGTFQPLWGERDQNFAIIGESGPAFVLKISNALETPDELDLQLQALKWLARSGPELSVPRPCPTLTGHDSARITGTSGTEHAVHLQTHLQGISFGLTDRAPSALRAAGMQAARVAKALSGFHHPSAGHKLFWDIRHIGEMIRYLPLIRDPALARRVEDIATHFCTDLLPEIERFRAQVVHHDTSPANVLVDSNNPTQMMALVDFGDLIHGPVIQDAAVAALELASSGKSLIDDAAAVISGYDTVFALEEAEIDFVYDLMLARAALGLLIGATRTANGVISVDDINYQNLYVPVLETLLDTGRMAVCASMRSVCQFPPQTPSVRVTDGRNAYRTSTLLERRQSVMGRALPVSYATPLHTEKGSGAWLIDVDGRHLLDCYNNVAHVGHCHPHVVRAVSRQAAALNTNTRYLFENVVTYSERLGRKMPGDLSVCVFVNSGSEAVDLALRMAAAVTEQSGKIAIEHAYHGITSESYAVSPSTDWAAPDGNARAHISLSRPDIALLANPDTLRGRYKACHPDVAERYAAEADRAIAQLNAAGHPLGAFIVDCSFSSHGILDVPKGYLASVAHRVRSAGGLVIADEVQYGFGRSGSHFWGFGLHDVIPDFVALGKPIGNGIALGCVVTTPQIMEKFSKGNEFFSTFGGNPVACAAAHAVLDVIETEKLQENAYTTGAYLMDGLLALSQEMPCIGAVRGKGLFIGVDIVTDIASMTPDRARSSSIKDHLRHNGVLISTDGFHGNVLKIRPPMVFSSDNADTLINRLQRAIVETDGT